MEGREKGCYSKGLRCPQPLSGELQKAEACGMLPWEINQHGRLCHS